MIWPLISLWKDSRTIGVLVWPRWWAPPQTWSGSCWQGAGGSPTASPTIVSTISSTSNEDFNQPSSQQYPAGATTTLTNHRLNNIQQEQRLKQSSSEQYIEWATTTLNNHRLNNIQCKNDDLKQLSSPTVNKTK